ncbi:nuclear transport factor 2 family protein [Tepidimonas charontis]|uniref:SnoaL-like domain protein n=1 Tax=Tepidimonas charontis TaxID=2267262 RepID=A0A554XHZ4_9BURK|nr:nuclear transport factor 2 family protein [Tepidimonas charontis]TSE35418.1 SnoaL-like domain protein [Tepidimonas charontis]
MNPLPPPAPPTAGAAAPTPADAVAHFFETLTPAALGQLDRIYTEGARFHDPFHSVQGLPAIRAIFEHMYGQLDAPRFVVRERLGDARQAFLIWDFFFYFRGQRRERRIHGSTHLRFAPDGRIREHRDYWDAAQEFYEQWPVLGALMRWLRRRVAAPGFEMEA